MKLMRALFKKKQKNNVPIPPIPPIEEIAKALETEKEMVVLALEAMQDTVSLSEPIYSDGVDSISLEDHLSDDRSLEDETADKISLQRALERLNEREKRIIDMRFYSGKTQSEVANEIGISQAQVSRLEKSALSQIRKQI